MPAKPIPDGYHTVTPYLMVKGARQFIDFMAAVFEPALRARGKVVAAPAELQRRSAAR